ncbi:hypothetical protein ACFFSH_29035 [Streptomyces filamentosus]|uniref:hypothetical protein n=1 Tax=Streptomyces TaxID=1883 RepID=UPI001678B36C|nr:hypothetical protein [Streptomyces filamentosus]
MNTPEIDAISTMDAARAALKETTPDVLDAICAVVAELFPEGKFLCANSLFVYTAEGRLTTGPLDRQRNPKYPHHLVWEWPLDRLPKRITRPHLGAHADSKKRTLKGLLNQARRAGAEIPYGGLGRHYAPRLTLR